MSRATHSLPTWFKKPTATPSEPVVLRLGLLAGLTILAVGVAFLLQRRRPEPPSSPSYRSIAEVDRSEFVRPDARLLVAMFGSTSCNTCPQVWETISKIDQSDIASERIDVQTDPERHRRYRIDGVPTTIVASSDGTVRKTMFGPITSAELNALLD